MPDYEAVVCLPSSCWIVANVLDVQGGDSKGGGCGRCIWSPPFLHLLNLNQSFHSVIAYRFNRFDSHFRSGLTILLHWRQTAKHEIDRVCFPTPIITLCLDFNGLGPRVASSNQLSVVCYWHSLPVLQASGQPAHVVFCSHFRPRRLNHLLYLRVNLYNPLRQPLLPRRVPQSPGW